MRDEIDQLLAGHMLRTHSAAEPMPADATQTLMAELQPHELRDRMRARLKGLRRRGVLNPLALAAYGLRPWLYLASGRTGQFDQVIRANTMRHQGVSHYVLYGDWDSLIVLYGSQPEAETFYTRLAAGAYDSPPLQLSVDGVLLSNGLQPIPLREDSRLSAEDVELLNQLVSDFDASIPAEQRSRLVRSGYLLGPTWNLGSVSGSGICAFVGLALHGRTSVGPDELLTSLRNTSVVAEYLRDAYHVSPSPPFPYLLRLSCQSPSQLDAATDALSLLRIRDVSIKCTTLVIASCNEAHPLFREPQVSDFPVGPAN
jgi:hypothetical protein